MLGEPLESKKERGERLIHLPSQATLIQWLGQDLKRGLPGSGLLVKMLSGTSDREKELFYSCEEPRQVDAMEKAHRKLQSFTLFSRGAWFVLLKPLTNKMKRSSN